jgi:hypothetical protein
MPKTRINCPNCRQPVVAEVEQLIDVGAEPALKQALLSGAVNVVQCPSCGYRGNLATPIVYHDSQKELLLTYFPPELGLPVNEQERTIGPLITKVTNSLPPEKRKAYLLRPQTMFTMQTLIERVLEADGITKEMIQAQQQRLGLIQRLMNLREDGDGYANQLAEIAQQEDKLIDAEFFELLSRLIEASMMAGDQASAQRLGELQKNLLPITTFGKELQTQTKEVESAIQALKDLGPNMTRDQLLDLTSRTDSETRLGVIVSLARPAFDYAFFQLLSERIDRARGDGRARLIELRENLLEITRAIDEQTVARQTQARQIVDTLINSADIRQATMQALSAVDDFFLRAFQESMDTARKQGDLEKIGKLKQIEEVLQQASTPPPELALIEELLQATSENDMRAKLEAHRQEITQEFLDLLTNILSQPQANGNPEMQARLQMIYTQALRMSMQAKL